MTEVNQLTITKIDATEPTIQENAQPEMGTNMEKYNPQGEVETRSLTGIHPDHSVYPRPDIEDSTKSASASTCEDGCTDSSNTDGSNNDSSNSDSGNSDSGNSDEDVKMAEKLSPSDEEDEESHPTVVPPSDIFRRVPRPAYPIRMKDEGWQPYPFKARKEWLKWGYSLTAGPNCEWRKQPPLHSLSNMIRPAIVRLGWSFDTLEVDLLSVGGHNSVYLVEIIDGCCVRECILRVTMPTDPYYKLECDVATTELVRHFTSIPVPIIYAYDSSAQNELSLEWMLMEKAIGHPLRTRWLDLPDDTHTRITRQIADWQDELSKITSNQIGGLYLHWTPADLEFFIDRCSEASFSTDRHIFYSFNRGPFRDINEFYDAMIHNQMLIYDDDVWLLLEDQQGRTIPSELRPKLELLQPKVQDILHEQVHPEDREDMGVLGPQLSPKLQSALAALRRALPHINPIDDGEESCYRLGHADISLNNIMVDDDANITALLDWEHTNLWPLLLHSNYPAYLEGSALPEESPPFQSSEIVMDDPQFGCWTLADYERLEAIQTRLRLVYESRLEELDSSLLAHFNGEDRSFELQLRRWACEEAPPPKKLIKWIRYQLDASQGINEDEVASNQKFETCRSVSIPKSPEPVIPPAPRPFSWQVQQAWSPWAHRCEYGAWPHWRNEPTLSHVAKTVRHVLRSFSFLGYYEIAWLATEGSSSVYRVEAKEKVTADHAQRMSRKSTPEYPHFKTGSAVATTELIRQLTDIPISIIYANDLVAANQLGLERIFMQRISGRKVFDIWQDLGIGTHIRITNRIAECQDQLSGITSRWIGGLFLRWTPDHLKCYISRIVNFHSAYLQELSYGFNRGFFRLMFDDTNAPLRQTLEEAREPLFQTLAITCRERERRIVVVGLKQKGKGLISFQLHKDDIEDWLEKESYWVETVPDTSGVEALRLALPTLYPPGAGLPLVTYLQPRKLTVGNIMMDSSGNIAALLDWEHLVFKPALFHDPWPLTLYGWHGADCLELNSQTPGYLNNVPGSEDCRAVSEHVGDVIATNLRMVYKQYLQELKSPFVVYREDQKEEDMRLSAWVSSPYDAPEPVLKIQPETSSGDETDDQERIHTPGPSTEDPCKEAPRQSDTLRTIPRPLYPIRVCEEGPHSMSQNARRRWLKTTVYLSAADKYEWRAEPKIELIAEVVAPTLEHLGVDSSTTRVSKLYRGGFNQVFTIAANGKDSSARREFVFRVPLPIIPYYKTECEVATMELVRTSTSIRLPVIYAYDSSTNNKIGLEWILMEKIPGVALTKKRHDLSEDILVDLTKQMADWQTELCSIQSTKIGGIYMRWVAEQLEFFVGPSVDLAFSCNRTLYYDVPHGPFESLNNYYSARLQRTEQELLDPLYLVLSKVNAPSDPRLHPDQQTVLSRLIPIMEEILGEELYEDERKNREESGPQLRWTEQSLPAVRALRNALWDISPTDPSHAMVTMLTHNDLAERNIMVDAGGRITGLLDWEYLDLQSLLFKKIEPYPEFVGSDEEEEQGADDDIEMMSNSGDETEDERLERPSYERYQAVTAHLRTVYKKRLEELGSPLVELFDKEETPETILRDRAVYGIEDDQEMIDWVNDQLKASAVQNSISGSDDGVNLSKFFKQEEKPDEVLGDHTGCAIEHDPQLMDRVVE